MAKARCVELQMLKFGQLIDIESLDQVQDTSPLFSLDKVPVSNQYIVPFTRQPGKDAWCGVSLKGALR